MSVYLSPGFGVGWQGLSSTAIPLNAGLLYTYIAGGTTPQATYTTYLGNVQNANPIVLGSDGRPPSEIWLTEGQSYRFDLKDSLGNLIKTYDNVSMSTFVTASTYAGSGGSALIGFLQSGSGAVTETLQSRGRWEVYLTDFLSDALRTDLRAGTPVTITTALANAQTALINGGVIYLPAGTLQLDSTFTVASNISLRGQGKNDTSIKWTGANNSAVIVFGHSTINSSMSDLEIDCHTKTTMTGLYCIDTRRNVFRSIRINTSEVATGIGVRMQAGSGGDGETYNNAFNRFYDLDIMGFQVGLQFDGTGTTPTVATLNEFYGLHIGDDIGLDNGSRTGIRFAQWCDSNSFHGVRISLTENNTFGIIHNDSATPAVEVGVYNNDFFDLAIDAFGLLSGVSGILFNATKQNQVYGFFSSPSPFPGVLINDFSSRSISHYIINNQRPVAENSIEIVRKGMWLADVLAKDSGGAAFGAGPTTITWNTEIYDVTGSFVNGTGIFTAPVTGKYLCTLALSHTNAATPADQWLIKLVTSAREYTYVYYVNAAAQTSFGFSVVADIAAAETAQWTVTRFAGGGSLTLVASADVNFTSISMVG